MFEETPRSFSFILAHRRMSMYRDGSSWGQKEFFTRFYAFLYNKSTVFKSVNVIFLWFSKVKKIDKLPIL
jgi:hypothetical protein